MISGYPTAVGTYAIPMTVAGSNNGGTSNRVASNSAKHGSSMPVRPKHRRTSLTTAAGNGAPPAVLTIQIISPDLSLPRMTLQPSGGSAMENQSFAFVASAVGVPAPSFQWSLNGVPLVAATEPALQVDMLKTSDSGSYTLTVSNAAGTVTSIPAMFVVQTTYALWQSDHFTPQEIAAGLANDNVSFSGDGVANLLKYALDLDPRAVVNHPLPIVSSYSGVDGTLQIGFDRDAGLTDINYLVEASSDLHTWTAVAQSVGGAPVTGLPGSAYAVETPVAGSSQRDVTVKAAPSGSSSQFLRLKIVRP